MASTDDVWAKTLGKLKVADIKSELTKRDLDIKGVKSVLIERLKTVFEEEGVDPEKYVFTSDEKQMKSSRRSGDVVDLEEEAGDPLDDHEESVSEQHVDTENGIGEELPDNGKRTLDQTENDSLNINLDDDDANLFKDQDFANVDSKGDPKSPPLPDSVPVLQPFTVHDTLRLADASRGQQPSDDLSMVVNVDALSERADDLDSTVNGADGHSPNDANGGGEQPASADPAATVASGGEKTGSDGKKDEAGQTGDSASKESKTTKSTKDKDADKANRNLWVSGLSSKTRATDLTSTFSKFGKVIGAKIVTNARTPGARCYGYITMATADDADKCIVSLHKTELHGHMIKVERSRDSGPPTRRAPGEKSERKPARRRSSPNANKDKSAAQKGSESVKDSVKSSDGTEKKDSVGENKGTSATKNRGDDRFRGRGGFRQRGVLTFQQIKEERERQRLREQERHLRELQRRRNDEIMRAREQDRRNKHEAFKLERERDRLRVERERIEREKVELMQLERDRQRLEREKLEREREELRRAAIRIHDAKRSVKRPSDDHHYPERKRSTMMAPPPPTISSRHVASASVAGAVGSTRYDERRYGGSSRGATTSSRQDYSRSEDRRVSERYEPSRRDEYRREERSTDYRRDSYETAKASSRHHSDRAVGNWHSGISAPRGTVSNGQRQQDWTSSSALDSGQWSRSGGTGQSSRWGSGGGSSSVRQSGLSAVSSIPGFVGGSSSGAMSGMMGSSVFSMSQDASRFDSYRRY